MGDLRALAGLLGDRNAIDQQITRLTGRPADKGPTGEYIARMVFDIKLEHSASYKAIDGHFRSGPLAGDGVNVKWRLKQSGFLSFKEDGAIPDYYLVMTGPYAPPGPSRDVFRPWVIEAVYLFHGPTLLDALRQRGTKLNAATYIPRALWTAGQLYPAQHNRVLPLTDAQRAMLALFG